MNLIENLICSQENNPVSHISPREVEKNTGICRTFRKMNENEKSIQTVQTFKEYNRK